MDHPTFDDEDKFWDWWKKAVSSRDHWRFPRDILVKAKLTLDNHLYERDFLSSDEQAKIVEAARKLAYFNPPVS